MSNLLLRKCVRQGSLSISVVFLCRTVLPVWSRDLVSASEDSRSCNLSCDGAAIHVLCVSGSLYLSVFVRPPRHTLSCVSSPKSIPDERKDCWCAYVPLTSVLLRLHGGWLMRKGVAVLIRIHSVMQFRGKSYFASRFQHIWGRSLQHVTEYISHTFACCVLWNCWIWSLFSLFLGFLQSLCFNNTALLYPVPATLVVLYQAARNYSLKLVQLTG